MKTRQGTLFRLQEMMRQEEVPLTASDKSERRIAGTRKSLRPRSVAKWNTYFKQENSTRRSCESSSLSSRRTRRCSSTKRIVSNFRLDTVASRRRSTSKSYYDNVLNSSKISNVQVMSSDEMRRNRVQDLPNDDGQAQ